MRTVDPELWSKKLKKPKIDVTRRNKFGQYPGPKYERIIQESLMDATHEFLENCSLPVVKLINMEDNSKFERSCYMLLLIVGMCSGVAVVSYNYHVYISTPPLVVNGLPSHSSIAQVNFPAVALCTNNVINKPTFDNYTDFLLNHPKNNLSGYQYNRSVIEAHLLKLGALLTMALPPLELHFDKFLADVEPHFNVTDIMFRFTPPCSSILERCSWRGRQVPCDTLFASRITPLGFCCVFNSRYYSVDANNEPHILDLIGQNLGLGVVMTENRDNFKYVRRNTDDAELLLFEGSEYPVLVSGDVRLYPLPTNYSLHFNAKILTQHAHDDLKYYSDDRRGCRTVGTGFCTCLAQCRRDIAVAMCGCVPYTLHAADDSEHRRVCSLRDLTCLYKHREKFIYIHPLNAYINDPQVSEEIQIGLHCPQCRVMCKRQLYWAKISYVQYQNAPDIYRNSLIEGLALVNSTIIRMFYASDQYKRFELEAYVRWYEVFALLSTQWIVFVGVSAIVFLEIIYFFTFRWIHHFLRRKRLSELRAPSV